MTLPVTGQLAISDINSELGLSPSYSSSLSFLSGYLKSPPASPNIGAFYGKAYYQRNADGNCNNGNCVAQGGPNGNCSNQGGPNGNCGNCGGPNGNCTSNCNCGNIQCTNCYIAGASDCSNCYNCTASDCSNCQVCTPINCGNCANCSPINCANCDGQNYLQDNCNCACTYNCTQSAVSYNCSTSAVSYNCNQAGPVSYNCTVGPVSYNCNCACNCSKIVCGKLYENGLMSQNIWAADQAYGRELRKTDKAMYRGYFRWARPVTQWMDGAGPDFMLWVPKDRRADAQKELMIELTHRVGTPWSEHMAYKMGALKNDNRQGRILMKIGRFFCRSVNLIPKMPTKYKQSKWTMPYSLLSSYTIWFLLELSYYMSIACIKASDLVETNKKAVKEY